MTINRFRLPATQTPRFAAHLLVLLGALWAVSGQPCRAEVLPPGLISDIAVVDQDGHTHRFFTDDGVHLPVVVMINEPLQLLRTSFSLGGSIPISRALTTWSATPVTNPTLPRNDKTKPRKNTL